MKNQKGFSLIELLDRRCHHRHHRSYRYPQSACRSSRQLMKVRLFRPLRTLHGAQMTYASTYGSGNYAPAIANMGGTLGLIDSVLAAGSAGWLRICRCCGRGYGYDPCYILLLDNSARPTGVTATGTRRFGVATDGVLEHDSANLTVIV